MWLGAMIKSEWIGRKNPNTCDLRKNGANRRVPCTTDWTHHLTTTFLPHELINIWAKYPPHFQLVLTENVDQMQGKEREKKSGGGGATCRHLRVSWPTKSPTFLSPILLFLLHYFCWWPRQERGKERAKPTFLHLEFELQSEETKKVNRLKLSLSVGLVRCWWIFEGES